MRCPDCCAGMEITCPECGKIIDGLADRLIAALENLENDDSSMPPTIWQAVLEALREAGSKRVLR